MNCGKCGVSNLEIAKYCRNCGSNMSFERNRGKINDKFFLVLCCVMLIMIVVSLIYYVVDVNTNEKLSDNLFTIKCNTF